MPRLVCWIFGHQWVLAPPVGALEPAVKILTWPKYCFRCGKRVGL